MLMEIQGQKTVSGCKNSFQTFYIAVMAKRSSVSPFCCLPIITIGVVDYRHCNQKNLKIYLLTLHKSVQMHIKWEYILKFRSSCDRISLLESVQMHGNGDCNDGD